MNSNDRLQLEKMINDNNVVDCTQDIRDKKHSPKIRKDVTKMIELKKKYERLSKSNPKQFDSMLISQCSFLFKNYTDIFNRVKKEEIKLSVLWELLNVLERIEKGEEDQHTGAYAVGQLLKQIYIDGALIKSEKLELNSGKKIKKPKNIKNISWNEYKIMREKRE